jgi:hypothetical protein
MRFYYFSLFSWIAYAVVVTAAIAVLWLVWSKLLGRKRLDAVYWGLVAAILVAPWSEELWIAYNFGHLCRKDAGLVISKTAKVDGFYDDTGTRTRLVSLPYKFVESPDGHGGYQRLERATEKEKEKTLAWYSETHSGFEPPKNAWITHTMNDTVRVVVEPDTGYAWRITKLDKPTAEYRFKLRWGGRAVRVAHKISMGDSTVWNARTGEVLAHYVRYARGPYWFYIGLDAPGIGCDGPNRGPYIKHCPLIYREILKPAK